jgi:hypothetical protein
MTDDFDHWFARNHPWDWWAKARGGEPLPHLDRLLVTELARLAYERKDRHADSADDDPYRRAAHQSLDARREGMARAREDGTAERAVDDLLKILGK